MITDFIRFSQIYHRNSVTKKMIDSVVPSYLYLFIYHLIYYYKFFYKFSKRVHKIKIVKNLYEFSLIHKCKNKGKTKVKKVEVRKIYNNVFVLLYN